MDGGHRRVAHDLGLSALATGQASFEFLVLSFEFFVLTSHLFEDFGWVGGNS